MIGVAGLTHRRYVIQPTGLDNRREDLIILVWFLAVLGSGFMVEGLRIGGTELHQHPGWAAWSPVGAAIAWVLDRLTMTQSQFLLWHRLWWWAHMLVTFGLLTYIGYSKLSHMIFSPLNMLLHKTRAKGELAPIADLDKALEGDEEAMARVRLVLGSWRILPGNNSSIWMRVRVVGAVRIIVRPGSVANPCRPSLSSLTCSGICTPPPPPYWQVRKNPLMGCACSVM